MLVRPVRRVGRPGLAGTVARTAVVAGTATAVAGSVSRKQAAKADQAQQAAAYQAEQQQAAMDAAAAQAVAAQQAAAPPPAAAGPDRVTQLKELADLKAQGILTDAEFESEKAKILAS